MFNLMIRKDFCFVLRLFMDAETASAKCNGPIHLIDFCIFHLSQPRHTFWFRIIARVCFMTQPWRLLNDPSVIITHWKPLPPVPVLSTITSKPKINI